MIYFYDKNNETIFVYRLRMFLEANSLDTEQIISSTTHLKRLIRAKVFRHIHHTKRKY